MEKTKITFEAAETQNEDNLSKFIDSYASFTRIVNSLQRKYIELREDFSTQNHELAIANQKLVELSDKNLKDNEFLNGILNSISVGVVAVDRDGLITHFNPAASVILGVPLQEAPGKLYRDVMPVSRPSDADAITAVEHGRTVDSIEKQFELKDGSVGSLAISTAILTDRDGQPSGAVEVFHDLTKVRRMEQEIARLTTLAALGEMAATIAHQVRNPLAGIGGFASLLERDLAESDPRRELVRKVKRGVESLNDTVTALLNYSRSDALNIVSVAYPELVQSIVDEFMASNAERPGEFKIQVTRTAGGSNSNPTANIDRLLMRQVFINLLTNALEVASGSGSATISYRVLSRQAAINRYSDRLILGVDETVLETTVADDGPGIKAEHIEQVFAPFFSTKQHGHGLGLAVAAKIMKAHGGDILVDTSVQKGVAFKLLLPVKIDGTKMERLG